MNDQPIQSETEEIIDEASKWGVGIGVVTVALFPLAIPIVVLTAVALLPLLIPLVAVGILAAPLLLVRSAVRRTRQRRADSRSRSDSRFIPRARAARAAPR